MTIESLPEAVPAGAVERTALVQEMTERLGDGPQPGDLADRELRYLLRSAGNLTGSPHFEEAFARFVEAYRQVQPATGGAGTGSDTLEDATRDELYELAKQVDVPGRSSMTKAELAQALREAGVTDAAEGPA